MDKSYIIITSTDGNEKNPCSVVGYPDTVADVFDTTYQSKTTPFDQLSEEDQAQVRAQLDDLLGADNARLVLEKNPNPRIFLLRKDARRVCAQLNKAWRGNGANPAHFQGRVVEVGDPTPRDVRPVLHWIIETSYGTDDDKTWLRSEMYTDQYPTRKTARAVFAHHERGDYRAVPVYGAWSVDPLIGSEYVQGYLRFRTKAAAKDWKENRACTEPMRAGRVTYYDQPVSEARLYVP